MTRRNKILGKPRKSRRNTSHRENGTCCMLLTLCNLIGYPPDMGWFCVYIEGSQVIIYTPTLIEYLSLKIVLVLANSAYSDEMPSLFAKVPVFWFPVYKGLSFS